MKARTINTRSNAYRTGTRQWHEWRAGFEDAVQAFVSRAMDSADKVRQ